MTRPGNIDDEVQVDDSRVRFDGLWSAQDRATIQRAIAQHNASGAAPSIPWDVSWLCVHRRLNGSDFYFAHGWLRGDVVVASTVNELAHNIESHRTPTD
jgi:hypothetical protein